MADITNLNNEWTREWTNVVQFKHEHKRSNFSKKKIIKKESKKGKKERMSEALRVSG